MNLDSIINSFARKHSTFSLPDEIADKQATQDEDQKAIDWVSGFNADYIPEGIDLVYNYDDAYYSKRSHVLSRIYYFRSDKYAIYSYNNNACGHCDVIPIAEDPGSIEDWLEFYWDIDTLPERWLAHLIGKEEEYDDINS